MQNATVSTEIAHEGNSAQSTVYLTFDLCYRAQSSNVCGNMLIQWFPTFKLAAPYRRGL